MERHAIDGERESYAATRRDIHPSRVERALRSVVGQLGDVFLPGELAYLAVTSKAELPVRDRLAWRLMADLGDGYFVAREWRRADLAVLVGPDPIAQLEAKALYTFDVLTDVGRQAYVNRLLSDAAKMKILAASDRYLLSIVTDIQGDIHQDLRRHVVKYSRDIARAAASHGGAVVQSLARSRWLEALTVFEAPTSHTVLDAGEVWGLQVVVEAFLTGPLPENGEAVGDDIRLDAVGSKDAKER